jgi:hypothetical protein
MVRLSRDLAPILLSAVLAGLAGCTLLGNFTTEQCTLDADCSALGPGPFTCQSNVCVPGGTGAGCTSNVQCTTETGKPAVCNRATGACAQLLVEGGACQLRYGEVRDDLVILAVLAPLDTTGATKAAGAHVTKMAVDEINLAGGLPTPGTDPPRQTSLLALVCNEDAAPADLEVELERLRDEVGVEAYLSEMPASQLRTLKDGGVLAHEVVLATRADEQQLVQMGFDEDDLLWHAVPNVSRLQTLYHATIGEAVNEASVRAMIPADDVRIAIVSGDFEAGSSALAENVLMQLDAEMPGQAQQFAIAKDDAQHTASAVSQLALYQPHVVVDFVGPTFASSLIPQMEEVDMGLTFGNSIYVGSPGSRYSEELLLTAQLTTDPEMELRFVGVEFYTDRELYDNFAERLPSLVPEGKAYGYNILYDAIYMMTYAVFAAGVTDLTPEKIADGLTRIDHGSPVFVGTTSSDSFALGIDRINFNLGGGDAFQFVGTTGPLDWDDPTGSRLTNVVGTYCLTYDSGAVHYDFGMRHFDVEDEVFVDAMGDPVPASEGACF